MVLMVLRVLKVLKVLGVLRVLRVLAETAMFDRRACCSRCDVLALLLTKMT
jgi:hypothetical protein